MKAVVQEFPRHDLQFMSYKELVNNPGLYTDEEGRYVWVPPHVMGEKGTPIFIHNENVEVYSSRNEPFKYRRITGSITITVTE